MRIFITLLMALLLSSGLGSGAWASVGEPFGVGYENPTELARVARENYRTDPKGERPIDSTKCLANGYSCASAQQYVEHFKLADPEGTRNLTVAGLPEYLEQLVPGTPEGEFWMACLKKNTREAMWNCLARSLHNGERAWQNPVTGKFVLAGDCTNPMGQKVVPPPECVEVDYYLKPGDEVHIAPLGHDPLPKSTCLSILKVGETEWSNVLLDECPRDECDYSGPVRDRKLPLQPGLRVSYKAAKEGWHRLRLPAFMLTTTDELIFCVIKPDGEQSVSKVITRRDYRKVGDRKVAYIGYPGYDKSVPPQGAFLHKWLWTNTFVPQ